MRILARSALILTALAVIVGCKDDTAKRNGASATGETAPTTAPATAPAAQPDTGARATGGVFEAPPATSPAR